MSHPFGDGNGRTGRLIEALFIRQNLCTNSPPRYKKISRLGFFKYSRKREMFFESSCTRVDTFWLICKRTVFVVQY
ncbi:MAG: Fic family protein [Deltaproteobacteria bacterium]|nr:Fic family protein [Deltaproteobacteria bacterium]